MSWLKTILFTILLQLLVVAPTLANSCEGINHSVRYGYRKSGDRLLIQESVAENWKFLCYAKKDLTYPLRGQEDLLEVEFTFIEIIDHYSNSHGGCPYITEGGIGHRNVKIHIESQFCRGFDFEINIYGI